MTTPVLFLAHGAPPLLDDHAWLAQLATWARALPTPRAVLMISAHWDEAPIRLGATQTVPLVYDYFGFPQRFYEVTYASPGAPELAARVRGLFDEAGLAHVDDPQRGLDHGAFLPLMAMWPDADVPVLQVSLPGADPRRVLAMGRALAPLRDEGILIMGSGFLTHNMRAGFSPTAGWAREFDAWVTDAITRRDVDALVDFQTRAPAAKLALPTWEHYAPLLVTVGAARPSDTIHFPIDGWWMDSSFTKRSVQLG